MLEKTKIILPSGFIFDYATMLGAGRIDAHELAAMEGSAAAAAAAVEEIRRSGHAKAHLSRDGAPEPVYFTRLPYVAEGNPNTPASLEELRELADYVRREVDAVLFLGVGGSYLGNKMLFDIFCGAGWNLLSAEERGGRPQVFFGGNNLDPQASLRLTRAITAAAGAEGKNGKYKLLLVPISKSGTTLETLTAFSYFYRIFAEQPLPELDVAVVTDLREEARSPLQLLAAERGWRRYDVRDGIGGRFSVLHNPGLVTAAAIGLDMERLLAGAGAMDAACRGGLYDNPALLNACLKYLAAGKGCGMEVLMGYGDCLKSLSEWYVQLLAESLGKRRDRAGREVFYGRTPIAATGSTDMHAQTQQHQDGKRNKVVQFIEIQDWGADVLPGNPFGSVEAFAAYAEVPLNRALKCALAANREALDGDGRYSAVYVLPTLDEFYLGQLLYFLMLSVAYEGELADVDAYDQPGVEAYKKIMKRTLGR